MRARQLPGSCCFQPDMAHHSPPPPKTLAPFPSISYNGFSLHIREAGRSVGNPLSRKLLLSIFIFLLLPPAGGSRIAAVDLLAPPYSSAGDYPNFVETADFNDDGIKDLAISSQYDEAITLLLGNGSGGMGDGTFSRLASIPVGGWPYNLTIFDLDKDGILDLIAAIRFYSGIKIMMGGGSAGIWDSTFSAPSFHYSGYGPYSSAVGDFNGDSIFDIVVANDGFALNTGDSISILIGAGDGGVWDGGFLDAYGYPVDSTPQMVITEDLNEDGILDLITANAHGNNVSVLIGNGSGGVGIGTFQPRVDYPVGSGPHSVLAGDFNEDDIIDLVTSNWNHDNITVLLGAGTAGVGDGTFDLISGYAAGDAPRRVVSADFDGDDIADLATCDFYGRTLTILTGRGSGGVGNGLFYGGKQYGAGGLAWSLVAADFDDDGVPDIVSVNPHEDAALFLKGNGDGTLADIGYADVSRAPCAIVTGDWNGDQILDLAVSCRDSGVVSILLGGGSGGDGDGTFSRSEDCATGADPADLVCADFNSDGILDLASADRADSTLSILIGDGAGGMGNGTFLPPVPCPTGAAPSALTAADLNGDGIIDLIVAKRELDQLGVHFGNGDGGGGNGTFSTPLLFSAGDGPVDLLTGDFNDDTIPDLALSCLDGNTLSILIGNGNAGTWDSTFAPPVAYAVGAAPRGLVMRDFNADGVSDLAVACSFSDDGLLAVYLDGDGILDLVAADSIGGTAALLLGNGLSGVGNGTFGVPEFRGVGAGIVALASGDFDNEGLHDLVLTGPCPVDMAPEQLMIVRNISVGTAVSIPGERPVSPSSLISMKCAPSPFNPSTTIELDIGRAGRSTLAVYTPSGRLVRLLHSGYRDIGQYSARWDGTDDAGHPAASGSYLIRWESPRAVHTIKAILIC